MTFAPDSPLVTHVVPADPTNIYDPANHGGIPNKPRGLVLHTPQEPSDDYESTPVYFSQPNRSASTHFYSDNDGDLFQLVPEHFGAIANGLRNKPRPAWADPNTSLNWQTLSIEIEGYAATIGQTLTARQRATVVAWIVDCAQRHAIPIDRAHVIGHYEVADNRSDPGTLDIDSLVREAQALAVPEEEESMGLPFTVKLADQRTFLIGLGRTLPIKDPVALQGLRDKKIVAPGPSIVVTEAELRQLGIVV